MRIFLALVVTLSLGACSGGGSLGNLNLFGWLRPGNSQNNAVQGRGLAPRGGFVVVQDARPVVGTLVQLVADRTASGVIIRATAVVPSEGFYAVDLVLASITDRGVATYQFRANPPATVRRIAPQNLRQLVSAVYLTDAQMQGISRVVVQSAGNQKSIRP